MEHAPTLFEIFEGQVPIAFQTLAVCIVLVLVISVLVRRELARVGDPPVEHPRQDLRHALALERRTAAQGVEHRRTEVVLIGSVVVPATAYHLGGDTGAEHRT